MIYPNIAFAQEVADIIDKQGFDIAESTDDPNEYYEEVGKRIVAAWEKHKEKAQ